VLDAGFVVGANLPWVNYGGDFGGSLWQPDGGVSRPEARARLRETLTALACQGITTIRWFMLCDGRSGILADPSTGLAALEPHVLPDLETAVDELDRAGLRAVMVLFDFLWFRPGDTINGVQTGGRAALLAEPGRRAQLLEAVVSPIILRAGGSPAIAAWDIVNEPEWVTRGSQGVTWRQASVDRGTMKEIIRDACALIHERSSRPVTVGLASASGLPLVRGLGLDFYQIHWYDSHERHAPLDTAVADYGLDRPMVLGEFPTRGSARPPADILRLARRCGYAGAFAWSWLATDEATDRAQFVAALP
jgi:hypothetical protein